ncbi:hypothetical protein V8F33_008468 [Rhypophila sp. PSN 637]
MAPYVFDLNIDNEVQSKYPIHFARHDTYSPLDGTTDVTPHLERERKVTISKGGGTDGLFTTISFWVGDSSEEDAKVKFDVYCEMAASAGANARARMGDCTGLDSSLFHHGWRSNLYNGRSDNNDEIHSTHAFNIMRKINELVPGMKKMMDAADPVEASWSIPIGDTIEQNGLRVELMDRDLDYPYSNARVRISSIDAESDSSSDSGS